MQLGYKNNLWYNIYRKVNFIIKLLIIFINFNKFKNILIVIIYEKKILKDAPKLRFYDLNSLF